MWLALDSSCLTLSLALTKPGGALVELVSLPPPTKQSDALPQAIAELLARNNVAMSSLTGLVAGLGPGSFTGLRIGLSCLKGLSYALKVPLTGASSLAAVALEGPEATELCCVAVVKKNELYLGRFRREGQTVKALAEETSLTVEAFAQLLLASPNSVALGPALVDYRAALLAAGVPEAQLSTAGTVPSAAALATLVSMPQTFDAQAMFALEPHYLRGSGAEENPKFPPLPGVDSRARLLTPKEPSHG